MLKRRDAIGIIIFCSLSKNDLSAVEWIALNIRYYFIMIIIICVCVCGKSRETFYFHMKQIITILHLTCECAPTPISNFTSEALKINWCLLVVNWNVNKFAHFRFMNEQIKFEFQKGASLKHFRFRIEWLRSKLYVESYTLNEFTWISSISSAQNDIIRGRIRNIRTQNYFEWFFWIRIKFRQLTGHHDDR